MWNLTRGGTTHTGVRITIHTIVDGGIGLIGAVDGTTRGTGLTGEVDGMTRGIDQATDHIGMAMDGTDQGTIDRDTTTRGIGLTDTALAVRTTAVRDTRQDTRTVADAQSHRDETPSMEFRAEIIVAAAAAETMLGM